MQNTQHNKTHLERIVPPGSVLSSKSGNSNDKKETEMLVDKFLKNQFIQDSNSQNPSSPNLVQEVTKNLEPLVISWLDKIKLNLKNPNDAISQEKVLILPYGSQRLQASLLDADIDYLILAPHFVDRDKHFFGELPEIFKQDQNISEIQTIKIAYVPLMKLKYKKYSIDLIFVATDTSKVSYSDLKILSNSSILSTMDNEMKRSLSGYNVTQKILDSVEKNREKFITTLKLVKVWARNKGIYSNVMGYLGGVSLAILVGKICQLFPNFEPNQLFKNFFIIYGKWHWDIHPVQIAEIEDHLIIQKQASERDIQMMVMTPVPQSMNSTYNVTYSNSQVIRKHLREGKRILENSNMQEAEKWDQIFEPFPFFQKYYQFLELSLGSDNKESYLKWRSLVESRLRHFTRIFDFYHYYMQIEIRPYPIPFERDGDLYNYCVSYYIGMKQPPLYDKIAKTLNFNQVVQDFLDEIRGSKTKADKLRFIPIKREDLPDLVFKEGRPEWATKDWIQKQVTKIEEKVNEIKTTNPPDGQAQSYRMFQNPVYNPYYYYNQMYFSGSYPNMVPEMNQFGVRGTTHSSTSNSTISTGTPSNMTKASDINKGSDLMKINDSLNSNFEGKK